MNASIIELIERTNAIVNQLEHCSWEELSDFVNHREKLINSILYSGVELTSETVAKLSDLRNNDDRIVAAMEKFKREASDWLTQRQTSKLGRSAYESSYSPDSILMDKKK